jgi:hypothetical protein
VAPAHHVPAVEGVATAAGADALDAPVAASPKATVPPAAAFKKQPAPHAATAAEAANRIPNPKLCASASLREKSRLSSYQH